MKRIAARRVDTDGHGFFTTKHAKYTKMESGKNLPQENAKNSRDIEQEETEKTEAVGYRGPIVTLGRRPNATGETPVPPLHDVEVNRQD